MKYGANVSLLYPHLPLEQRPAAAAADGFHGIEILFPYRLDVTALHRCIEEASLQLVLINTPPGETGERGLAAIPGAEHRFRDGFRLALDTARQLRCSTVHTMAGSVDPAAPRHRALATLLANLRWAAPRAAEHGITLTLEGLNRTDMPGYCYATARQVIEVLGELGEPNVRLQFDLYHTAMEGLSALSEIVHAWPWIHHVQIAGPPERHEPTGEDRDLFDAVRWLDDAGYDGWLGFEYRPLHDTTAGLAWRAHLPPEQTRSH